MTLYINGVNEGIGAHASSTQARTAWVGARLIMPIGDSITFGSFGTDGGGYRTELFTKAAQAGKPPEFVGSVGPGGPSSIMGFQFPGMHEGHIGFKIADFWNGSSGPIDSALSTYAPTIALVHIGTNDIPVDPTGAPSRLAALLDRMHADSAGLAIFVAQIIPSADGPTDTIIQTYNASVATVVSTRTAFCTLVDHHTPFVNTPSYQTALLADGTHPNDAGYRLMGDTWFAAVD